MLEVIVYDETQDLDDFSIQPKGLSQVAGRPPTSKNNELSISRYFSIHLDFYRFSNLPAISQPATSQPATSQPPETGILFPQTPGSLNYWRTPTLIFEKSIL